MTTASAVLQLERAAAGLVSAIDAARVTVCEDAPMRGRTAAVDALGEAMVELSSDAAHLLRQVQAVSGEGREALREDVKLLIDGAQSEFHSIADCLADRVSAFGPMSELELFSLRAGSEWRAWWATSERAIADCEAGTRAVRDALHSCWLELAETGGVTVSHARVGRVSVASEPTYPEPAQTLSPTAHRLGAGRAGQQETPGGNR